MKKRIIAWMLVLTSMFSFNLYAIAQETSATSNTSTDSSNINGDGVKKEEGITLTIDEAVKKGLENSMAMDKVKNKAQLAVLISQNARVTEDDINDATDRIKQAERSLDSGRSTLYSSMSQLDSAQAAIDNGRVPSEGIPVANPINKQQILFTIPKGTRIDQIDEYLQQPEIVECLKNNGLDKYITSDAIIAGAKKKLEESRNQLNNGLAQLDASTQEYESGKNKYDLSMQFAMIGVANKLSTSTISSLDPEQLGKLIIKMADIQDKTVSYSVDIYKNKIALLIQNSYYEVLKQEKLLVVKDKAMERAELQNEYAQAAYEVGAKSKDDMIYAKLYYDSTVIAKELQLKEYNNAMTELKKNINMPLDAKINLVAVEQSTKVTDKKDDATKVSNTKSDESIKIEPIVESEFDLSKGIESGLKTRLEMKMAEAKVQLYKDLKEAVDNSDYDEDDNQYKEAKLLGKEADIELKDTKLQVESEIRKSYETVMTMEKVAKTAKTLEENAAETVEISKLKYEVGFGASNALMKQLNLEDLSGTMAEVIAAEENLATIQGKAIEAVNGYNLAKAKYLNDIGILPYK